MSFPGSIPTIDEVSPTESQNSATNGGHANLHNLTSQLALALAVKVGIDGSPDTSSLDYKIAQLQKLTPRTLRIVTTTTSLAADAANGTEETALFAHTIPAATLAAAGDKLLLSLWGRTTRSGFGGPTMRWRLRLGGVSGTVLLDTGAVGNQANTNRMLHLVAEITCRTPGASGEVWPTGILTWGSVYANALLPDPIESSGNIDVLLAQSAVVGPINLTNALDLVWTIEHSAATAGNIGYIDSGHLQLLKAP